jgi:hypothetical protein
MRLIIGAALLMVGSQPTFAVAAAPPPSADPTSNQCAVAYLAAQSEKERLQGASVNNESTDSLLNFIENGRTIDYRARAAEVREKHEASWTVAEQAPWMEVSGLSKKFFVEGTMASSDYYFSPATVFQTQREILGRLPACDRIFGFKPAAGPLPTQEAVVLHFKNLAEKRMARDDARRDSLDDTQCAIRFWVVAGSVQDPTQRQQAQQAANYAFGKVLAAQPGMTRERLAEVIQRQGMEYGQKLSNESNAKLFQDDIMTCTARYNYEIEQQRKASQPAP